MVLHIFTVGLGGTEIIKTNGVSFSLIVGSICYVEFKYILRPTNSSAAYTLNINSLGAKTLQLFSSDGKGYSNSKTHYNYDGTATGATWLAIPVPAGAVMVIYDGTYYSYIGTAGVNYYSDYSDYQD